MDEETSEEMVCAGGAKLSSLESFSASGPSYPNFGNPSDPEEVPSETSVTSSCSVQCLNCKRLTYELAQVCEDMDVLRRRNGIPLSRMRGRKSEPDAEYAKSYSEEEQSPTVCACESVEDTESDSCPKDDAELQDSPPGVNFTFSIDVDFVLENQGPECGKHCEDSKSVKNQDPGSVKDELAHSKAPAVPQLRAMITIQMKMMHGPFETPTITCFEKTGDGFGPGQWLIELRGPNLNHSSDDNDDEDYGRAAAGVRDKMNQEVTHVLQTIREFFEQHVSSDMLRHLSKMLR